MTVTPLLGLGDFGTNCYILGTDSKNAILIDAPYSADIISARLDSLGLSLKKILLTHGHCDHIEALSGLCKRYSCEVYISADDAAMLADPALCLAKYFGTPFEPFYGAKAISDGDEVTLDEARLKTLLTPGHSAGSVCYISDDCIFTGDTLFEGSVGRTDLGGDFAELLGSIKKLFELGRNYTIRPGHGSPSDLYTERRFNPYLAALRGE